MKEDKIICNTSKFPDFLTFGRIYEVIVNDGFGNILIKCDDNLVRS